MIDIRLIIGGVLLIIFAITGWYVKGLNDQVVTCKANTAIMQANYKRDKANYERDKKSIVKFYDDKQKDVDAFKRRTDETDCDATQRFFDGRSYN